MVRHKKLKAAQCFRPKFVSSSIEESKIHMFVSYETLLNYKMSFKEDPSSTYRGNSL